MKGKQFVKPNFNKAKLDRPYIWTVLVQMIWIWTLNQVFEWDAKLQLVPDHHKADQILFHQYLNTWIKDFYLICLLSGVFVNFVKIGIKGENSEFIFVLDRHKADQILFHQYSR